jgi:hypothetical protein
MMSPPRQMRDSLAREMSVTFIRGIDADRGEIVQAYQPDAGE